MEAVITCEYKKGKRGTVFMKSVDKESGRAYAYIQLDPNVIEVFFEGEYQLV